MNKDEDIYKDDFIRKLMKDVDLEETSDQFTNQVMDDVMQDWLAKPIEMSKPISKYQWIWIVGLVIVLVIILLGTDVRTLISHVDSPFWNQLDAVLLQPLNRVLIKVFDSLIKLPVMVYIVAISLGGLAVFDRIITKLMHYR